MPLTLTKTSDFGPDFSGLTSSSGISYTVLKSDGSTQSGPTTAGVYELMSGSGIYGASVVFPDNFNGSLLWKASGSLGIIFAAEEQNYLGTNPKVDDTWTMVNALTGTITGLSGTLQGLWDIAFGRWKINTSNNTMVFYQQDNATVVATFNLYDNNGNPAFDSVFERRLVGNVTP